MTESSSIIRRYKSARDSYHQALGVHNDRKAQMETVIAELDNLTKLSEYTEMALQILEAVATAARSRICDRIDKPVTMALQTVYQDGTLSFTTELDRTGDRMEAKFMFARGGQGIPGPVIDSTGGGLLDIASFTLRVCLFKMLGCTGMIILDEPFRHVEEDALVRASEFAHEVANNMGIQIIASTHASSIAASADQTIELVARGRVKVHGEEDG